MVVANVDSVLIWVSVIQEQKSSLERHNRHVKAKLIFNQLLLINDFLKTIVHWLTNESKRYSDLHADSPMEHVSDKTSREAIARIRHV